MSTRQKNTIILATILSVFLAVPTFVMAAIEIKNTANLEYKDEANKDYTASTQAVLKKLLPAEVEITKLMRNVSRGENFIESTNGTPGEVIEYQVTLHNKGEDIARWVVVTDTLPEGVTFNENAYGDGKGIKIDDVAQTNQYDPADDKANFGKVTNTITVGANQAGDNGNATEITIPGGKSVVILYQVTID